MQLFSHSPAGLSYCSSLITGKVLLNLGENTIRIGPVVHRRTGELYCCFLRVSVMIDGIVVAVLKILFMS